MTEKKLYLIVQSVLCVLLVILLYIHGHKLMFNQLVTASNTM